MSEKPKQHAGPSAAAKGHFRSKAHMPNADGGEYSEADVRGLAREVLEQTGGDVRRATSKLVTRLSKDSALLKSVSGILVEIAAFDLMRRSTLQSRTQITSAFDGPGAISALASGLLETLYNFPLADGTPLGDATKPQLLKQITAYRERATTEIRRAMWLEQVAKITPAGKTVRQAVKAARLAQLYRESMGESQ